MVKLPFKIYLVSLQLVLVPRGGRKTSRCTSLHCSLYFLVLSDHFAYSGVFRIVLCGSLIMCTWPKPANLAQKTWPRRKFSVLYVFITLKAHSLKNLLIKKAF